LPCGAAAPFSLSPLRSLQQQQQASVCCKPKFQIPNSKFQNPRGQKVFARGEFQKWKNEKCQNANRRFLLLQETAG
jgi:hypothetical protein